MSNISDEFVSENLPDKKINVPNLDPVQVCEVTIVINEPEKVKSQRYFRERGALINLIKFFETKIF